MVVLEVLAVTEQAVDQCTASRADGRSAVERQVQNAQRVRYPPELTRVEIGDQRQIVVKTKLKPNPHEKRNLPMIIIDKIAAIYSTGRLKDYEASSATRLRGVI
ncbi:hypothetical protein ASF70_08180 [Rhizobium sp. Leaf321]|uniref:hypothetical protein n=1 Tax=Rhizobium sp. Leaf321 TaxID=1736335 RepID=UPI000713FBE3|nr:hypothetical protein [Rhizobium sp. Leaf321]KQQ73770.1 hypothetical protein ASF70_08180 [Rhizobium sp. Leaf321]